MRTEFDAAGKVTGEVVEGVRPEMRQVQNDPDAVFFCSFVQARATVYRAGGRSIAGMQLDHQRRRGYLEAAQGRRCATAAIQRPSACRDVRPTQRRKHDHGG